MILYRYLGSHWEDTLTNCRLKISKASDFDDPFEFLVKDKIAINESFMDKLYSEIFPFKDAIQKKAFFDGLSHDFKEKIHKELIKNEEARYKIMPTQEIADQFFRILCFCGTEIRPSDEVLVWSFYASKHVGYRLQFEFTKEKHPLHKVIYEDHILEYDLALLDSLEKSKRIIVSSFIRKSKSWKFTDEYRFIMEKNSCFTDQGLDYINFCPSLLKRIDLGLRFPNKDIENLLSIVRLKCPDVPVFKAYLSDKSYKMEYKKIKF